ncbi:MAG: hypothetical protein P4L84_12885 [Isosphaeraceae bacterium]|nr:hypothetical protein [Isosphaeraceae bacterium]
MAPRTMTTTPPTPPEAPLPRVIEVADLTGKSSSRSLWRRRKGRATTAPQPGRPSPMGYWLTELHGADTGAGQSLRVELSASEDSFAGEPVPVTSCCPCGRPAQTVRLKGPNAGDGELVLTVGDRYARVVTSPAAWNVLAEPVLLAVCQYWRFGSVDEQLDRLTEQAEADIGDATMSVPSTLRKRSRLLATARDVRTLLLDLPHFMEPLTDPYAFCSSDRAVQAYRSLAEKLHLAAWCEAIDDRFEAVDDAYAAVTEKLFEYRNFAWGAALEIAIIVILLADLIFQLWEHFATK